MRAKYLFAVLGFFLVLAGHDSIAQGTIETKPSAPTVKSTTGAALRDLYQQHGGELLWYCTSCKAKRVALVDYILHSDTLGLQPEQYLSGGAKRYLETSKTDTAGLQKADEQLSEIALRFSSDLYTGADREHLLSYDEVSSQYTEADMSFLVKSWSRATSAAELIATLNSLQPATQQYQALRKTLQHLPVSEHEKRGALLASMNYYRWIHHFPLDRYIVVNIPAANLHFYNGSTDMQMRTVVGTPDDRTPRFASHINEISLYPYWNMPRSIMMDEWFDLIKDNRAVLDYHELEIIDSKGTVIPYENVKWKNMNSRNFPYRIRQKTGCANPLGVVKFGMNNPFDVYLHDTPGKGAFDGKNRYYSHGCVRVEDAVMLAQAILPGKVDERYLKACFSDQQPQVLPVPDRVPVFIVYMAAEADASGKVIFYKDMYKLWAKAESRK